MAQEKYPGIQQQDPMGPVRMNTNYMNYIEHSQGYEDDKYGDYLSTDNGTYSSSTIIAKDAFSENIAVQRPMLRENAQPMPTGFDPRQSSLLSQSVGERTRRPQEQNYKPQSSSVQQYPQQQPQGTKTQQGFEVLNRGSLSKRPENLEVFPIGKNYYSCPLCQSTAIRTCACQYRDAECFSGHKWFVNGQGMIQIGISPGHGARMIQTTQQTPPSSTNNPQYA